MRNLARQRDICEGPAPVKCLACSDLRTTASPRAPWRSSAFSGSAHCSAARRPRSTASAASSHQKMRPRPARRRRARRGRAELPRGRRRRRRSTRRSSSAFRAEPFILFVGAFRRLKGIDELFTAYSRLDAPPPLVIAGTRAPDTPTPVPGWRLVLDRRPPRHRDGDVGSGPVRRLPEQVAGAARDRGPRGDEQRAAGDRHQARWSRGHDRRRRDGLLVPAGDVDGAGGGDVSC